MFKRNQIKELLLSYLDNPISACALFILLFIIFIALFSQWISPQNPYDLTQISVMDARLEPGSLSTYSNKQYLLGTDEQGRDLLSAIFYGLRVSLVVGVSATCIALVFGATLGILAGYYGGRIESIIMRIADMQLSFPAILIALILIATLGQGVSKVIMALVAVQWAYYARAARSAAIVESKKEYIEAAILLKLSTFKILFSHLLPNCLPPLLVVAALQIASAISLEATLSFLGLGLPITEPSLGLLIANGFQFVLSGKYWISFFPGIALALTIISINLVADQLRDVLNPRFQGRAS